MFGPQARNHCFVGSSVLLVCGLCAEPLWYGVWDCNLQTLHIPSR